MPDMSSNDVAARLARLRAIPPQQATPDTVGEARDLAELLTGEQGSAMWFEAQMHLGNHLLESPAGVRAQNVAQAEAAYRRILQLAPPGSREWSAGEFGLANSLLKRPGSGPEEFGEASGIYEQLIEHASSVADAESQIAFLGNAASMYGAAAHGDQAANLERAIELQERVLLPPLDAALTQATRARAQHNLGALYLRRKSGVESQNVDRAVRLFEAALAGRPEDVDPVGRVRTLRALAQAYPKWAGADSLAHGHELAARAAAESEQIEARSPVMQHRVKGWANVTRQQSAMVFEMPELQDMPRDAALQWLSTQVRNHLAALAEIPRDSEPVLWAEWRAGLGRLLAQLPRLDVKDRIAEALDCFRDALAAIDPGRHTRLYCDIAARMGELAHEVGDFELSWRVYAVAASARDVLLAPIADFDHRLAELRARRGYGLFAAYAATRLDHASEALQLAEGERARALDELIEGLRVAAELPPEERAEIAVLIQQIRESRSRLLELREMSPEGQMRRMRAALADFAGIAPDAINVRLTGAERDAARPDAEEAARLNRDLVTARNRLRERSRAIAQGFDAPQISALAQSTGAAIVYVLATAWGTAVAAALPDGGLCALHTQELTSDRTVRLAHGGEGQEGFARAIASEDPAALANYLDTLEEVVGDSLIRPLAARLRELGVTRAVLVPMGSFSALPLQAIEQDDVAFSFAPSARLLALARGRGNPLAEGPAAMISSPSRPDEAALPWSIVESRFLEQLLAGADLRHAEHEEATLPRLRDAAAGARYLHVATHAQFRPADPLGSRLLLAGDDQLTLQEAMAGEIDVSAARLVNLAACQTGNAESVNAPDEHLGFGSILMSLGVPAVVSTRWNVDDAAAALFSVRLLQLLYAERAEPIAAVARARDWLRTVTAAELRDLVVNLQRALHPEDAGARTVLAMLRSELALSPPDEPTRFAAKTHWGAFMLTGL